MRLIPSCLLALLALSSFLQNALASQNQCSHMDCTYQLIERIVAFEHKNTEMEKKLMVVERRNEELEITVNDLQNEIRNNSRSQTVVSFVAQRTSHVTLSSDQALIFNKILTNTHGAYNPDTGIFEAPVKGNYLFSTTVLSQNNGQYAHLRIVKNHKVDLGVFFTGNGGGHGSGSETVVVDLEKGDEVCVKEYRGNTGHIYAEFTSFMGVLLTQF